MTEPGLVTVIIPNRNHAEYLPRALDAFLTQTWPKLQIVVVDDASSDDSREVLARYAARDPRVAFIARQQHEGIARAVSAGLEIARGEFLCLAGADDFVQPHFIERCVTEMSRNPEAAFSFSDPTEVREPLQKIIPFPLHLSERPTYFTPDALIALLKRNYFHMSSNTGLYRLRAFREAGGYDPELHWLMDWFTGLVMALRHGVCYLPEQLTFLTVRGDSYSAHNLRDGKAQRPLLERVLKLLASPTYADIAPKMRRAGLLPEYHPRTFFWLLQSREGRKFITAALVLRILARYSWSFFRPIAPAAWRRQLRRLHNHRTRAMSVSATQCDVRSIGRR
jgi:glycosyltransferase involved in cell wall biosynthesis